MIGFGFGLGAGLKPAGIACFLRNIGDDGEGGGYELRVVWRVSLPF